MLVCMPRLMMNNLMTRIWLLEPLNSGYFIRSKLRINGTLKTAWS